MIKMLKCFIIVFLISFFISSQCNAKAYDFLFWYPGGAGNSEDAKPFIDAFTNHINKKISPDTLNGIYINDEKTGVEYIRKNKPAYAIISYPMWLKIKSENKSAIEWLTTLPLPSGKNTEKYLLVSGTSNPTATYTTFPLSDSFLEIAFPNAPKTVPFKHIPRILGTLKKISEGDAYNAILTPDEALSLASLTAKWAEDLTKTESHPVPSPKLILFDDNISINNKLKNILKQIHKDSSAKNILIDLRLKGFE